MKKPFLLLLSGCGLLCSTFAQPPKTDLFNLVKKLVYDSTGYTNVGDWAVGRPAKYPVAWRADKIEMSDDTSINFYRMGSANISLNGKSFTHQNGPVKWNIMLKGARSGYTSFSILSTPSSGLQPRYTIDSVFGNKGYTAKLLKSCDNNTVAGFYYYEVKMPKKDVAYIKLSWLSANNNTAIRIDVYDSWSNYAAKLNCPG